MAFPYARHLVSLRHRQEYSHLLIRYKKNLQRGASSFGNAFSASGNENHRSVLWLACLYCLFHSQSGREWQICCISTHIDIKQCHPMNTANHVYFLKACMNVIAAFKPCLFCEERCIQWMWFQNRADFFSLSMKFPRESHWDAHLHQSKAKQHGYHSSFDFSKFGTSTIRAITQSYWSMHLP